MSLIKFKEKQHLASLWLFKHHPAFISTLMGQENRPESHFSPQSFQQFPTASTQQ
jgi:hypothetical protein